MWHPDHPRSSGSYDEDRATGVYKELMAMITTPLGYEFTLEQIIKDWNIADGRGQDFVFTNDTVMGLIQEIQRLTEKVESSIQVGDRVICPLFTSMGRAADIRYGDVGVVVSPPYPSDYIYVCWPSGNLFHEIHELVKV
jgi:hypothetical protein